jgi:hypothetical protein
MRKARKTYKESHAAMRKRQKGYRRKGIDWEWNGDGKFSTEKMGKFFKRYWRKWKARKVKIYDRLDPESGV